jgi:NADPH:quinone reductase-like Zn-dependent oxidoreductase
MKAVVYDRYGPPEVLRVEEAPKPRPQAGEVLVRVHAVAVTRADCATRDANRHSGAVAMAISRLVYGVRAPKRGILGSEFAGVVDEAGDGVHRLAAGDRVFGTTGFRFGAYAEYVCVAEDGRVGPIPAGLGFTEAAPMCDGGQYALWCLRQAELTPGQTVLVYGASGAIGTAGVQLARHFGARVTAVSGAKNLDLVRSLGAERAIDYEREDFTKSGETYDVVFDAVGKMSFQRCLRALKPRGRYLATDGLGNFFLGMWTARFGAKKVMFKLPPRFTRADVLFLAGLVDAGELKTVVDRTYPMEQIVEATRYVETEQKTGNVVLTIAP